MEIEFIRFGTTAVFGGSRTEKKDVFRGELGTTKYDFLNFRAIGLSSALYDVSSEVAV